MISNQIITGYSVNGSEYKCNPKGMIIRQDNRIRQGKRNLKGTDEKEVERQFVKKTFWSLSNLNGFPLDLGEIYICYDVASTNAKKYGNTLDRELCFLFVHGLLHLLGYDHQTKEQEEIMFSLQDKILPPKEI